MGRYLLHYKGEHLRLPVGDFTLGRAVDSGLHLDDVEASRAHAVLHVGERSLIIEDLQSRNGVYVNDERVEGERTLAHADVIGIGAQRIEVVEERERRRRASMTTVNSAVASQRLQRELQDVTGAAELPEELSQLSPRELEVLKLVVHGHTHKEVAQKLHVSVKTVETYRARIAIKLGLKKRAELVRYAIEVGLLSGAEG